MFRSAVRISVFVSHKFSEWAHKHASLWHSATVARHSSLRSAHCAGGRRSVVPCRSSPARDGDRRPSLIAEKHRLLIAVVVACRQLQTGRRSARLGARGISRSALPSAGIVIDGCINNSYTLNRWTDCIRPSRGGSWLNTLFYRYC